VVASVEALVAAGVAATAVYFLASLVPLVAEHSVWVAFLAMPLMLALALAVPIVALAVVFLRWGDRRQFVVACGFTVVATIVGAVVGSWFIGCSQGCG
jgi:hypothetical protein